MKTKDWIMLWIIIGIGFFFVGGMINSTFQSEELKDDTIYKISSAIKLVGLGILVSILIIGGIIGNDLNKYFRLTLLIIGLILLLIFTIAAQFMKWDTTFVDESIPSIGDTNDNDNVEYESRPSTPGFEIFIGIIAISSIVIYKKYKNKG